MNRIALSLVFAAAFLSAVPSAMAARITGKCRPTAVTFASNPDSFQQFTSGSYSQITGMNLGFIQGGNAPSCVIVEFQAQVHAPASGDTLLSLDARLDDNDNDDYITGAQPQFMANSGMWNVANSMKFIWIDVPPGNHNVKILVRSANGGTVSLSRPTMIIYSAP